MKKVSIVLILAIALVSCGGGKTKKTKEQNETNLQFAKAASYQFAISNKDGSKFLILQEHGDEFGESDFFGELEFAVYNGKIYGVKFIGKQQGNEENDNGRQNFENFENLHGTIFKNSDGKLISPNADEYDAVWEAILLVNQAFLDENKLITFTQPEEPEEASESTIKALEKQFGRKVISTQKVISFGKNGENSFFSVQFENKGNQALGVYMTETADGKRAYIEFPARFEDNDDGYALSVWHVDDDGQFIAPFISAVFKQDDSYIFLTEDTAFESTTTFFIRHSEDKLIIDEESSFNRYTSPM